MRCRFCHTELSIPFIDLGASPLSNAFLAQERLGEPEIFYPLKLMVCPECLLVQVDEHARAEDIFNEEYAYFSSISSSWVEHARRYVEGIIPRLGLGPDSFVVEIAANDGYLLQFIQAASIPCLGIEPSANTADAAKAKGIPVRCEYFGADLARTLVQEGKRPDLVIGNNVLAHVPRLNDFVEGLAILLAPTGTLTLEFPHLMRLVAENQFDTIYHEHFSYFSLATCSRVLAQSGLAVVDVEELPTHGGSLRVHAMHRGAGTVSERVVELLAREDAAGMNGMEYYQGFQAKADAVKNGLLEFLLQAKRDGRKVCGYGAAAKGNTLLNYAGVRPDLLPFIVDASPHKQGLFTPGMRIPVTGEAAIKEHKPDFVLILPWNIKDEIMRQLAYIRDWGGRFATPIPGLALH